MKKTILLFIILAFCSCNSRFYNQYLTNKRSFVVIQNGKIKVLSKTQTHSETGQISGFIFSKDDKLPIKGAIVTNTNKTKGQSTDVNGYFKFNLTGLDTLNISYLGYQDLVFPVQLNKGEHLELKIILGTKTFYDRWLIKTTNHNTDNMGKLFVTLFAGDLHASRAKNGCWVWARTLFFFLIFYLNIKLGWPDKFV